MNVVILVFIKVKTDVEEKEKMIDKLEEKVIFFTIEFTIHNNTLTVFLEF